MTSKKRFIRGERPPSLGGRGTTTVKREILGGGTGNTYRSNQKSKQSTTKPSKK